MAAVVVLGRPSGPRRLLPQSLRWSQFRSIIKPQAVGTSRSSPVQASCCLQLRRPGPSSWPVGKSRRIVNGGHPRHTPTNNLNAVRANHGWIAGLADPAQATGLATLHRFPIQVDTATAIKEHGAPPIVLPIANPLTLHSTSSLLSVSDLAPDFARRQVSKQQHTNYSTSALFHRNIFSSSSTMSPQTVNKTNLYPTGIQYVFQV